MPRNLDVMTDDEREIARSVAIVAAETLAHQHGNAEVGEAEFLISLVNLGAAIQIELAGCVRALRSSGTSWADIGSLLGMTKQAAQQQYGRVAAPMASSPATGAGC